ncbi:MAG: hypothetical protein V7644_1652 [Actinomycetota bacterium]
MLAVLVAAAAASVLAVLLAAKAAPSPARAADHLDAPGLTPPGGSVQTDITDLYAFQSPTDAANTVLVLNVNGVASPGEVAPGQDRPFADEIPLVEKSAPVTYNLHVDNNGDAITDVNIAVRFDKAQADGSQKLKVELKGTKDDKVKAKLKGDSTPFGGTPVVNREDGITAFAGRRDDPFFFDLPGFLNILGPGRSLIGCGTAASHPERNFFAGRNVSSIVLELPSKLLTADSSKIGVWASTNVPDLQIDRMGRPAIATVFIPNNPIPPDRVVDGKSSLKSTYNHSDPANDQANFRGEIVDSLTTLFSLNDATDPNPGDDASQIQGLANFLLPDILTYDTASTAGFPNGRKLNDDVIDTELGLITEGAVTTDCVPADNSLLGTFPYVGNPN